MRFRNVDRRVLRAGNCDRFSREGPFAVSQEFFAIARDQASFITHAAIAGIYGVAK